MPVAEAAPADADSLPAAVQAPDQTSQLPSAPQTISPPETLSAESSASLSGSDAVAPAVTPAVTPDAGMAQPAADVAPQIKLDAASSAQPALEKPPAHLLHPEPKADAAPAAPQKADSELGRTIAGMRQVVEKRLAAIVNQDKLSRETQWQQALIYTTLQYAWTGRFDEARQVAQHPALATDLQTELLAKITMIQLERQPAQIAVGQSVPAGQPNSAALGRMIPSGYSAGLSGASSYSVSLGQQCPITPLSPAGQKTKLTASDQPAQRVSAATQAGIPDFVPALSQNLAGRLVKLSQLPPKLVSPELASQPAYQPTQQPQPVSIQPPAMFVGVASRVQASTHAKLTALALPKVAAAVPSVSEPQTQSVEGLQRQPVVQSERPQIQPSGFDQLTQRQIADQIADQTADQTAGLMPAFWNLDQLLDNALDQSLGQLGEQLSFLPDWFSTPLQSNWNPWTQPSPAQPNPAQPSSTQPNPAQSARAQSAQSSLLPLEQVAAPQLGRDMRKLPSLALPTIPAQPVATAAALKAPKAPAKPVVYDTTALLAMNCTQDQLTHYGSDQVIDPASAKQMGWINLLFPLPIAAVLTSAFGWRVHPISGALSFHTGLDMGAPMGTPVLAAAAGRVMVADHMGGYGLAVVVEAGNQRNLYGHLSGIAVQPGTQVAQGAILGWVGSTGNSTGPHLHFESQVATSNGWTAVNPIATATLASAGQ